MRRRSRANGWRTGGRPAGAGGRRTCFSRKGLTHCPGYIGYDGWHLQFLGPCWTMKTNSGSSNLSDSPAAQPVCPSVLTPAEVIQTYDDVRWEEFTLEYLGAEQPAYAFIEPKGGAGDKGRDIVAHTVAPPASGPVDIFQCKAYEAALTPSSIWVELGKLCVFTHRGDYPVPRKYMFMAPHGVGTKLGD